MADSRIIEAGRAFVSAVNDACAPSVPDTDMIEGFRDSGTIHDRFLASQVLMVGELIRRGVFTTHGYTRPEYAIADLLGWDRRPARRRVKLAEQVCPRVTLDGQPLPALLPATATVFAEGRITVAVAEAIVNVVNGPAATRLHPDTWAGVEEQVAHYAATTRATPNEVSGWAQQLVEAYDQDGAEPQPEPEQVNELWLTRKPGGTGFWVRGELNGPVGEAVSTAIGALSKPRPTTTGRTNPSDPSDGTNPSDPSAGTNPSDPSAGTNPSDGTDLSDPSGGTDASGTGGYVDERTLAQRQADALGEICGFSLSHDDTLPDTGGERPQIRLTIDLERLRSAVSGAHLDTGAWYSPSQLRMLACDCSVVPAILNSTSEPLDIGRATRTIPAGIRRAVAIRDRGCSYPGCGQAPARCDVHHCVEWVDGGDTALHNCTMLCKAHHLIVHGAGWAVRIRDGHPEFIPPAFLDPLQRARRRAIASIR